MAAKHRISGLDGLRAIAIAIVFLSHYVTALFPGQAWPEKVFPGMLGVALFFVLSGFLISTLLLREFERTGTIGVGRFYIRRFIRLGPPLYVYVAATLLFYLAVDGRAELADFVAAAGYYANYYQAFTRSDMHFMPVWSLAIEEHFYLVFPLLALVALSRSFRTFFLVVIVALVACTSWRLYLVLHGSVDFTDVYLRTDLRIDSILFGVFLACLVRSDRRPFTEGNAIGVLVAALALLGVSAVYRDETFRMTSRYTLQGAGFALAIGLILVNESRFAAYARDALDARPLRYLGAISYSLYLWHLTFIKAYERLDPNPSRLAVVFCALASIVLAAASYELLEKRFISMRRRFGSDA